MDSSLFFFNYSKLFTLAIQGFKRSLQKHIQIKTKFCSLNPLYMDEIYVEILDTDCRHLQKKSNDKIRV